MDSVTRLDANSDGSNDQIWHVCGLNLNVNVEKRWGYLTRPARRPGGNPLPRLSHSRWPHGAPEGRGTAGYSGTQTPCEASDKESKRRSVRGEKHRRMDHFHGRRSHTATSHNNTTLTRKKANKQEAAPAKKPNKASAARLLKPSEPPTALSNRADEYVQLNWTE